MLSLYKLEVFLTAVKEGSFSGAARRLYMTQPAVSQHIQDLEKQLGTKLFERLPRGVKLTQSGEKLNGYSERILFLVAEAENAVTDVASIEDGSIHIGATPGVSNYLFFEWVRGFNEKFPNLSVVLQTGITPEIVKGIVGRKLNLGFIEGELDGMRHNGLSNLVLEPIPMSVIVSNNHDWNGRKEVKISELDRIPLITRQRGSRTRLWIDDVFRQHNIQPNIIAELDNIEAIKQAVMSNMGISILPAYAINRELHDGKLRQIAVKKLRLERNLKLIWDSDAPLNPITRAFVEHMTQFYPPIQTLI